MASLLRSVRQRFAQPRRDPASIQLWRQQMLRLLCVLLTVVCAPILVLHLYSSLLRQEYLRAALALAACGFSIALAFLPRLPYTVRAVGLLAIWYAVGAGLLLLLGLAGSGRVILVAAAILAAVMLGRRGAVAAWCLAMLLLALGLGAHVVLVQGVALDAAQLSLLFVNGLVAAAISGTIVVALLSLMERFSNSLRDAGEANATLEMMLRMLPDLVWFKDGTGRYKFASDAFFAFHGKSREQVLDSRAEELFPSQRTARMASGDAYVQQTGQRYYSEALIPTTDGSTIWLDTIKTPVYDDQGRLVGILGTSHDITARKLAEEALERQARYAQALARAAQLLLARGESQWDRVSEALEQLRAAVDVSRCFVYGFNAAPGTPGILVADRMELGAPIYVGRQIEFEQMPADFRAAMLERRWLGGPTAGRWPDCPELQELYDRNGIQSTLTVPLYVDGALWGHMGFSDRTAPREWDEATVQLVQIAAELIAASIASWEDARALRERTEAAEAADRAKSAFLATMSHEIRTPLNAVVGTAELLAETPLDGEQRALAELIRGGGEALIETVNSILDYSKIEAGRIELEHRPFDLFACVDEALGMVARSAAQKGIALDLRRDPALPRAVIGDVTRLRRVLINLLANAVKFTERGAVLLEVAPSDAPLPQGAATLRFSVRDTGIGIPPDRLGEIFEPFAQADSSTTRRYGGTGLGLAISRQLVALMGGRIEVRSGVDQGSTFTVLLALPAAEAERWGELCAPGLAEALPARPLRILVAEDNRVNQDVTRLMLARLGHRAEIVADGVAAVAAVARSPFDVVLMDVQMPELDGMEATRRIRAMGAQIAQPRIVALTANALRGDRERYLAAGMDDYLGKPIHLRGLHAALALAAPARAAAFPALHGLIDPASLAAQLEVLGGGERAHSLVLRLLSQEIAGQIQSLARAAAAGLAARVPPRHPGAAAPERGLRFLARKPR
jgi:PAS domain S-box-containing protein